VARAKDDILPGQAFHKLTPFILTHNSQHIGVPFRLLPIHDHLPLPSRVQQIGSIMWRIRRRNQFGIEAKRSRILVETRPIAFAILETISIELRMTRRILGQQASFHEHGRSSRS